MAKIAHIIGGIGVIMLMMAASCGGGTKSEQSTVVDTLQTEQYHANDDIAMTVSSIADAIRVGEPIDTTEYRYESILTDGQGRPLYANLHGMPGKWSIDAVSENALTIHNTELGDLLTEDLEGYLIATLGLTEKNLIDSLAEPEKKGHTVHVYDFGGGRIRFEVHNTETPEGAESPIMIITLSR